MCGPSDIADFCREGQEPVDVIHCSSEEGRHLCTRLRKLGWEAIAEQLEGAS